MEPNQECCILQSHTQVFVSPKHRTLFSSSQSNVSGGNVRGSAGALVGNSETHEDLSRDEIQNQPEVELSPMNRLVAGFKRILFGSETDSIADDVAESVAYKSEAWNIKTKLFCRVLALEDFSVGKLKNSITSDVQLSDDDKHCSNGPMLREILSCQNLSVDSINSLQQPTNVYVSIFTILSSLPFMNLDSVPCTFLASLFRLRSPSEKIAANRLQHAMSARLNSADTEETDSSVNMRRIIVRVIVTNFNSESCCCGFQFMQQIPQKHILISSLLRRQMNLSVTDKVALAPLHTPSHVHPAKMNVYPLFSIVSYVPL